ncbi:hypothetical protein GGR57DRAFT_478941 [Xylariaceae sp. FL1272]|nr:hypothetical protein GGR57DRAFT_478941 [Xylariaceae sp. FL1272]
MLTAFYQPFRQFIRRSSSSRRSKSNKSTRSSTSAESRTFPSSRIDENKLHDLCNRNFGHNYSVELQLDNYTVHSVPALTDAEIMSCRVSRRCHWT